MKLTISGDLNGRTEKQRAHAIAADYRTKGFEAHVKREAIGRQMVTTITISDATEVKPTV